MPKRTATPRQMSLLDWTPPEAVERFDEQLVRASTITGRVCRGVSQALRDAGQDGRSREDIARAMSEFLGTEVSKNMLDAYASQAREDHIINVVRWVALIHATRDRRLLEDIAMMFGWAVIDRKHLGLIKIAALRAKKEEIERDLELEQRMAKDRGAY